MESRERVGVISAGPSSCHNGPWGLRMPVSPGYCACGKMRTRQNVALVENDPRRLRRGTTAAPMLSFRKKRRSLSERRVLKSICKFLRQISGFCWAKRFIRSRKLKPLSSEEIFSRYYRGNKWGGKDSVSGRGSDDDQTVIIVKALPGLCADFGISTILDIPCGDFHWMKKVDLGNMAYVGADIVGDMIASNTEQFGSNSTKFRQLDLVNDPLPRVDLVFCRDCLGSPLFCGYLCRVKQPVRQPGRVRPDHDLYGCARKPGYCDGPMAPHQSRSGSFPFSATAQNHQRRLQRGWRGIQGQVAWSLEVVGCSVVFNKEISLSAQRHVRCGDSQTAVLSWL